LFNHYALRNPVVRHLQHQQAPFTWEDSYAAETRREDVKLVGGKATAELRTGYAIPIQLVSGVLAAVPFGASHTALHPDAVAELALAANLRSATLLRLRHRAKGSGAYGDTP
jgi:hypothetical protein